MKLSVLGVLAMVVVALSSATASAASCEDEFTGKTGSEWSNAANWKTGAVPTEKTIVCWSGGLTPVIGSSAAKAASISSGGGLTIEGGGLTLAASGATSSLSGKLSIEGALSGAGTIDLSGALSMTKGDIQANIDQTGGNAFTVAGSSQVYLTGGTIETSSPIDIESKEFITANKPTLRTTSTIKFASGDYPENGGASVHMYAAGYITSGATAVPNFELNLTGSLSKIEGGVFAVPVLNTEAGTTMTVSAGASVSTSGGSISGKITGAGGYGETASTTTFESGSTLSTATAKLENGTLDVKSGAKYEVGSETDIASGTLTLEGAGSTGAFKLAKGSCGGTGPLTVTGTFTWEAGQCSLNIKQTGGNAFTVAGSSQAYLTGGTIETSSPIDIESKEFITANKPTLRTTSTIKFASGDYPENGGASVNMYANGFLIAASTEIPNYALHSTGGTSTIPAGAKLSRAPLTIEGGEVIDEGELEPGSTLELTGGKLSGTGTVDGAVENSAGTVEPGHGSSGKLDITGSYTQGAGATLSVTVQGTVPITDFGQLDVGSSVALGGELSVTDSGFTPSGSERFLVLESKSMPGGKFAALSGPGASLYEAGYEAKGAYLKAAPVRPVNTTLPVISGTPVARHTLTCSEGTWTPTPSEFEFEWKLNGSTITGAEAATYTVPAGDEGKQITCVVTAYYEGLESEPVSSAQVMVIGVPASTEAPKLTGTPAAGQTLTCSTGTWSESPNALSYEWQLEGTTIAGATEATYKVPSADEGKQITCRVSATNAAGTSTPASSGPVTVATAPLNTAAPSITGIAASGETLTCAPGTWTGSPTSYTYVWALEGSPIAGATGSTYRILAIDEGHTITCTVTASNGVSATASTSIAVPKPSLALSCSGQPIVLVTVRQSGRSVVLSGFALARYAGHKVTITVSGVPRKSAKGGTTTVKPGGAFEATLRAPTGARAPLTRYTATIEGHASLALKLGRQTKITGYRTVAGGVNVTLKIEGALGHNSGIVTVTRQESCTATRVVAKVRLSKSKTLTLTLASPTTAGETFYYRAQTRIAGGTTYSLPIGVDSAS